MSARGFYPAALGTLLAMERQQTHAMACLPAVFSCSFSQRLIVSSILSR